MPLMFRAVVPLCLLSLGATILAQPSASRAPAIASPAALDARFATVVAPFLETYCFECHSGAEPEAELDLSAITSRTAAANEPRWGLILEMLESGEMPA